MSEVLVTGGCGFIGSHLTDRLLADGHSVDVIDNLSTGKFENLNREARFYHNDITVRTEIPKNEYDYIFHLAAKARVQPSIQRPDIYHEANVNGTLNIIERAREIGAKVVFASSSSIYGEAGVPTLEVASARPQSPYALQKAIGEQYLKLYNELYGLDYTALRYFSVYGDRQIPNGAYATVVGIFLDQRKQGKPLFINGDGKARRDFTHVGDVVEATARAMDWPAEAYNIGSGQNYSVNEIAMAVGGERIYKNPVIEPRETLADNSKARRLGWVPEVNVINWIQTQC